MQSELFVTAQEAGARTPVVLSHALGLDHRMWHDFVADLASARPILLYDHRGHGRSFKPPGPYALDTLVVDAARLIEQWGRWPVVFVGLSMGGMVAQGLAISRPDLVKGLVLAHTVAAYNVIAKNAWQQRAELVEQRGMSAVVDMIIGRYLHSEFRATRPDVVRLLSGILLDCDPRAYAASCRAIAQVNWLPCLAQIKCPTLVLAGALDQGATPQMAAQISERICGARLEVLNGASHLSVLEAPEEFTCSVTAHLAICDALR